jgi:hypothetical protein
VVVMTSFSIQQILQKAEVSERLDVSFRSRVMVKGQVIADFLSEVPNGKDVLKAKEDVKVNDMWFLYTDGSSNTDGFSACSILILKRFILFVIFLSN